jgi:hypothetical protein
VIPLGDTQHSSAETMDELEDPTQDVWCPELDTLGGDAAASVHIWMPELARGSRKLAHASVHIWMPELRGRSSSPRGRSSSPRSTGRRSSTSRSRSRRESKSEEPGGAQRKRRQRKAQQDSCLEEAQLHEELSPALTPAAQLQNDIAAKLEALNLKASAPAKTNGNVPIWRITHEEWLDLRQSIRHLSKVLPCLSALVAR